MKLCVNVKNAENLPEKDPYGACDSYVTLRLGSSEECYQTRVIDADRSPQYNEIVEIFTEIGNIKSSILHVVIRNFCIKEEDDFDIAQCDILLNDIIPGKIISKELNLKPMINNLKENNEPRLALDFHYINLKQVPFDKTGRINNDTQKRTYMNIRNTDDINPFVIMRLQNGTNYAINNPFPFNNNIYNIPIGFLYRDMDDRLQEIMRNREINNRNNQPFPFYRDNFVPPPFFNRERINPSGFQTYRPNPQHFQSNNNRVNINNNRVDNNNIEIISSSYQEDSDDDSFSIPSNDQFSFSSNDYDDDNDDYYSD